MNLDFFNFIYRIQEATGIVEEGASGVTEKVTDVSIWDLIWGFDPETGSYSLTSILIMTILFVLSLFAIYIFIERFLSVQRALKEERDFMAKIKDYVNDGKLDAAKQLCTSTDNPMARMIGKGISRIGKPIKDIAGSIENVGKLEVYRLEARMSVLATIAGIAPMIGFLGTVLGMIKTMHVMSNEGVEIQSLSGGIFEAMFTTVGGLIVGIIAYVFYNYLVSKVAKVIQKMEGSSIEFLDILDTPSN